jgi:hypothetical protein
MNVAIDITTNEEIDAEELYTIENINLDNYQCVGCTIKVTPCAFKPHNIPRAYFKKEQEHIAGCSLVSKTKLKRIALNKSIFTQNSRPFSPPYKLELRDEKITTIKIDELAVSKGGVQENRYIKTGNESVKQPGLKTVMTLTQFVDQFISFPKDHHLPILLPGFGKEKSYSESFKRIRYFNHIEIYKDNFIFFDSVFTKKYRPVVNQNETTIEVHLVTGKWQENSITNKKELVKPVTVLFNISTWPTIHINALLKKINNCTPEKENWKNESPIIFFLGHQDKNDPYLFHCSDRRLMHCLPVSVKLLKSLSSKL